MGRIVEHEGDDIVMPQSMVAEHLRGAVRRRIEIAIADRLARFGDDDGGLVGMGTRMNGGVHRTSSPDAFFIPRNSSGSKLWVKAPPRAGSAARSRAP